jgi:hypothetical protein
LEDRLSYFILDNTSNNDTYMEKLGEEYGFNY